MAGSPRDAAAPSRALDVAGLVAVALMLLGPTLAWLRLVPAMGGFVPFALGGLLALVVAIIAVGGVIRGRALGRGGGLAALVAAAAFIWLAGRTAGAPRINDFTTDPGDPPRFTHAATIPENAGRDLAYPADFATIQRACCDDLAPTRMSADPREAFVLVAAAAERMPGWRITRRDPEAGELEAVATSGVFGFHDDVVVRVRPDAAGGSRIDVRSKSRDGRGDLGANAARIRAFQAALGTSGGGSG